MPFAVAVLVFLLIALSCGGMALAALAACGAWLGHPVLVYLGRISYGLYVFRERPFLRVKERFAYVPSAHLATQDTKPAPA